MRLLYDGPLGLREVSITGGRVATVGELADALGLSPTTAGLWVQDQWAAADDRLDEAGVVDGARVGVRPSPGPDEPGWAVEAVGGLCAGDHGPLGTQGAVVGRSPEADLTLPIVGLRPQHARVEYRDGGVWLQVGDGEAELVEASTPLRLGRALIQASPSPDDRPHRLAVILGRTASGRIAFNRPPRPAMPDPPEPLPTPAGEPTRSSRATAFGWAALVAPLVAGLLMAVLYSPYMALFALLSPLMMGATWFDNRRRDRSERRRSRRRSQTSLAAFAEVAAEAHAEEIGRQRDQCPHLAEAVRRVRQPSVRLWERRPGHDDFMVLAAAHGALPFAPELVVDGPKPAPEAIAALEQLGPLPDVPIPVELGPGKLVGVVGPRTATTAIARALVLQAAVHHGPADVAVLVAADEVTAPGWAWTAWLPHTAHPALGGRRRLIANHREAVVNQAADLAEAWQQRGDGPWPLLLAVVDGDNLVTGRKPPARPLLLGAAGPIAGLVLASSVDQLPAAATTVIEARDLSGSVDITLSHSGETMESVLATGMSLSLARDTARRLARFEDPELPGADSGTPERSSLINLLDLLPPDGPSTPADPAGTGALSGGWAAPDDLASDIGARWQASEQDDRLIAPIGADGHGPLMADLVADGPHALVGGTTGSGKSELLRTLVASLAATYSPEQVNFVLVDYKGGSAFDACGALPHVVGLVTDLDDRLAERALRCLEAELRHREQTLRDRGATDLAHYRTLTKSGAEPPRPDQSAAEAAELGAEPPRLDRRSADAATAETWSPLPRLVVVIDEFAALAGELPGFMDSLVNVAQRGRSLGMHLVLATQRPAGAVSANIRTNTALRIALRMLDATDSVDILDSPEAAAIGRDQPGRAYARFGPGELVEFQAALVTGATAARGGLRVAPAPDGLPAPEPEAAPDDGDDVPGDLARLAQAAVEAWSRRGGTPPRRPWPDPLPQLVSLDELASHDPTGGDPTSCAGKVPDIGATGDRTTSSVAFALADDPNRQCQYPMMWDPGQGSVLFAGSPGSGTTTALGSLAIALARRHPPDACHLYVIDFGSGQLSPLEGLPHCGAVVGADEPDRLRRLIRRLEAELDLRTSRGRTSSEPDQPPPLVVTLVDNWGGLAKTLDNVTDHALLATLERVWAEGPAVGLCLAAAADQLSKVNRSLQATTPQTFVFRLGDPALYRQWGVAVDDPTTLPPGRGFAIPSGIELQVAVPDDGLAAAVDQVAAGRSTALSATIAHSPATHSPTSGPPPVESLPSSVDPARLDPARLNASPVYLPLGLSDDTLAPVGFTLYPKEHALILGPPRSGRTTALALLAAVTASADAQVIALAPEGSPLHHSPHIHLATPDPHELSHAATATNLPTLALVDDAETIPDPNGTLKALATDTRPGLHIVAAGRPDRLRTAYGHWTAEIRFSRTGVLLQPTPLDGDLFNLQLPTRPTLPPTPGRGYLIQNTTPTILQIAHYGEQTDFS